MLIDTSGSTKTAEIILKNINAISNKKICYIVTTHGHPDHYLGSTVFKHRRIKFIIHENFNKYLKSYFSKYQNIWNHGDWVTEKNNGGFIVHGRSDSTLNRFGVRIGSSEIYSLIEKNEKIEDSLIIHLDSIENDLLILFIVSRDKFDSDQIKKHIKENRSPRHVPDKIYCCPAIPYTISGKKLEVPIKKILNGENPNNVLSLDSLKNPESIEWFINFRKKELNII